jgi:hypothetical protein
MRAAAGSPGRRNTARIAADTAGASDAAVRSKNARVTSFNSTGNVYAASRLRPAASWWIALSGLGSELCPPLFVASISKLWYTFSLACTVRASRRPFLTIPPPPSLSANEASISCL